MTDYLGLLEQCEALYADVCFEPEDWPDSALASWIESLAESTEIDKESARQLRRVVRAAQKLRRFWETPAANLPPDHGDFRTRVDIGVGVAAWRPLLDLARHGLESRPDPALYEDVKERFRVVAGDRWMEGVDYETWLADR